MDRIENGPLLRRMLARRTAIVVVDMQNDYCAPGGVIHQLGYDVSHFAGVGRRFARFLAAARAQVDHVAFVRTVFPDWPLSSAMQLHYGRSKLHRTRGADLADWFGVAPAPTDAVIEKFRYSAFKDTTLHAYLRARGIENLIIGGATTDVCVDSTVRDAFMNDFSVIVLADCCGASTPERQSHTLGVLNDFFACVVDSEAVLAVMGPQPATQHP
ncbi:cysteine hydrolase family protein [Castellaniella sp.]|uniref:cysteine hydrolase family protein n=1 Tax=Castellaniella sp. TaxID=1955812 RepID=UPI00356852D4